MSRDIVEFMILSTPFTELRNITANIWRIHRPLKVFIAKFTKAKKVKILK